MNNKGLSNSIINATKWSSVTEVFAKMIVPITNMILARILSPEIFGVIATITIVITFAEMISDSGFHKYLIQRDFKDEESKNQSIQVAFWTNLSIACLLWLLLIFFKDHIALLLGNSSLGWAIAIAGFSIPMTSFSSIQSALYKRDLEYRVLFFARIVTIIMPFVVTIPMALLGFGYWSLIVSTLCGNIFNAIYLTYKSQYKPKFYYSFKVLKNMISYSGWSLAESISIWATSYLGIFIIANKMSEYYLGLYNTTIITVNGVFALVTVSTTSVLFSSLSKLQHLDSEFTEMYLKFIRYASIIILPMGIFIFTFRRLITQILLGSQWMEASFFVGIWGLMSSITIIFGQYCSEVYRAKGRPKLSLVVQILYLTLLIPALYFGASIDFQALIYFASFIKIAQILINLYVMDRFFHIKSIRILSTVKMSIYSTLSLGVFSLVSISINDSILWEICTLAFSLILYAYILIYFANTQQIFDNLPSFFSKLRFKRIYK